MPTRKEKPTDIVLEMLDQWRRERPDLDSTGMGIVLRVLIFSQQLQQRLKRTLRPFDLRPWEFDVLSALRRVGRPFALTPADLCESARLTSGAMTHRIDRLEERALVRRKTVGSDGRSVLVTLTGKGRRLVDRAIVARVDDATRSVSALTANEREDLAILLARVLGVASDRDRSSR